MKTREITPFGVRIPPDLKSQVKDAAAREGRSMNAQIVQHLRTIYQPAEGETADQFAESFLRFTADNAVAKASRKASA